MTRHDAGPLLGEIAAVLRAIGIPHMVVGSFASSFHGKPRTTLDLDIVIDPTREQLDELLRRLPAERFYVDADVARDALRRRTMFNIIDMTSAWKLDFIVRKARPFSVEELARRRTESILGVDVDTATAEDTIVSKLEWSKASGSDRQLQDVAEILKTRGDMIDQAYIERWIEELELGEQWARARAL